MGRSRRLPVSGRCLPVGTHQVMCRSCAESTPALGGDANLRVAGRGRPFRRVDADGGAGPPPRRRRSVPIPRAILSGRVTALLARAMHTGLACGQRQGRAFIAPLRAPESRSAGVPRARRADARISVPLCGWGEPLRPREPERERAAGPGRAVRALQCSSAPAPCRLTRRCGLGRCPGPLRRLPLGTDS